MPFIKEKQSTFATNIRQGIRGKDNEKENIY